MRGRLALADIKLSRPLGVWLDAVYAVFADAPAEVLQKLGEQMVKKSAMVRPDEARENWGRTPEQIAMAGRLGRGRGLEAGGSAGQAPEARRTRPNPQQYIHGGRRGMS